MENKQFTDPLDVPNSKGQLPERLRTSATYLLEHNAFLTSLRGRAGTIQTTANILLQKAYDELKRNGFTYDPDAYELAIANCTIILGGTALGVRTGPGNPVAAEAASGNDGPGTGGLGCKATANANVPANVRKPSSGSRRKVKDASQGESGHQ